MNFRITFYVLVVLVLFVVVLYQTFFKNYKIVNLVSISYLKRNSNVSNQTEINLIGLNKYIKIHNSIINGTNSSKKKIIFVNDLPVGYANKLYGVLSGLTIAILTDRAIILHWSIDKYIQPPLLNVFKKYDPSSQFSINYNQGKDNKQVRDGTPNTWQYKKNLKSLLNNHIENDTRLVFSSISSYFFDICANAIYYKKLQGYGLVSSTTIEKAAEAFFDYNNLTEFERINRLYMTGFEVASNLLKNIWLIEPSFLKEINKYYEENFENNFVIGIQFRFEYIYDKDIEQFIDCAKYVQEINHINTSKWFVTSDSERIFTILKQYVNESNILHGNGKIGHIMWDANNYFRTIMDNELLSRSNEIIITGGSTYGFVASIKNGKLPYFVEGRRSNQYDKNNPCQRMSFDNGPRTPSSANVIR